MKRLEAPGRQTELTGEERPLKWPGKRKRSAKSTNLVYFQRPTLRKRGEQPTSCILSLLTPPLPSPPTPLSPSPPRCPSPGIIFFVRNFPGHSKKKKMENSPIMKLIRAFIFLILEKRFLGTDFEKAFCNWLNACFRQEFKIM